jgi:hypothetical protein
MKSVRLLLMAAFAILFSACGTPNAKITPKPDIKPVITSNQRAINDIKVDSQRYFEDSNQHQIHASRYRRRPQERKGRAGRAG